MKIKMTLAALALTLSPGLALAYECNSSKYMMETTAMSCAEGSVMDAETGTCVPMVTG